LAHPASHFIRTIARSQIADQQEDVEKYKPGSSSAATTPTSGATATPGKAAPAAPAEYEDIPVSNMRRTIGKRLTESKQQLPHYYLTVEVNMGESLTACRSRMLT
jgi:pyruvate/2-oxoglutarate dehydrogenase complex dihydrolipoamide acyltransferase (E2) component